jgi:hypothetical protein
MRADPGAVPAHPVRQARGSEPKLRIFEPFPALYQHLVGGKAQIVDHNDPATTRRRGIDRFEHTFDTDRRIGQIDEERASAVPRPFHNDADSRGLALGKVAPIRHDMGRQDHGTPRKIAQFTHQIVRRAGSKASRIKLVRDDDVATESLDPLCDFRRTDPSCAVHAHIQSFGADPTSSPGKTRHKKDSRLMEF